MLWERTSVNNLTRKKNGVYYCRVKVEGKSRVRSLGTKKMDIARMKLPKVLDEMRSLDVQKQTGNLGESVEKWWEMKNVESDMQAATLKYWEMSMNFVYNTCLLYTSPSPRDKRQSRMPSSA